MNKKHKTIIIIALALIWTVYAVGTTYAYFSNRIEVNKTLSAPTYSTEITDTFESPNNWMPGETVPKQILVRNSGQVKVAVRVSYNYSWESSSGQSLSNTLNNQDVAIINFTSHHHWTSVVENGTTYYYYKYNLDPSAQTMDSFISSVTLNENVVGDYSCSEQLSSSKDEILPVFLESTVCQADGGDYDNATFTINFTIETIQYDIYKTYWNTNINITNTPALSTFYIGGNEYQYLEGMTWGEWIDSSYNTSNFYVDDNDDYKIKRNVGIYESTIECQGAYVVETDIIDPSLEYELYGGGGADN